MPRTATTVCFAGVAYAVHDAGAAVCRSLVRGTSGEPSHAVAVRLSRRRGPEDLIDDAARGATHSSMPEMTRAEVEAAFAAALISPANVFPASISPLSISPAQTCPRLGAVQSNV